MIHRYAATLGSQVHEIAVEALEGGRWRVTLDGRERVVDARRVEAGVWSLVPEGGGRVRIVDVLPGQNPGDVISSTGGQSFALKIGDARQALATRAAPARAQSGPQPIRAPMPGKVIKVMVAAGDAVKTHQGVVVVEAMKMENELRAPRDGKVVEIKVKEGQAVDAGQTLVTIE